jgi:hypothetical protein
VNFDVVLLELPAVDHFQSSRQYAGIIDRVGSIRIDPHQSGKRRSRKAFAMTETELAVMAALATIGLSSHPKTG